MIIDFRLRPPAKGFEKLSIFGQQKGFEMFPWNYRTTKPIVSALEHSMPEFLEEMDEAGIVKGVILPRNTAIGWGGVSNDEVVAVSREYPDRFIPFASVDVSMGISESLEELERAAGLGCKGLVVEPGCCTPPLRANSAPLYPLYQKCQELGLPVVVSLSMMLGPDISFARPEHVQQAASDFPKVNFIIAHASYPYILEALSVAAIRENVWLIPDVYMNVAEVSGHELFVQGVRMLQGERILFGSAYPIRDLVQSVEQVKSFGLSDDMLEKIFCLNARKLLNI